MPAMNSGRRSRNLGLAGGSLWLVAVSIAFSAWGLLAARSRLATSLLGGMSVAAVLLIVFGIQLIRGILQLPSMAAVHSSGKNLMLRRFRLIVVAECVAFTIVNLACVLTHRWTLIAPLDLIIVGIHFLPLARLFDVPRYNLLGGLFCAIPIATMLLIPSSAHLGHAFSWLVIPSVGCALAALSIAGAGLNEVGQFVNASRANAMS